MEEVLDPQQRYSDRFSTAHNLKSVDIHALCKTEIWVRNIIKPNLCTDLQIGLQERNMQEKNCDLLGRAIGILYWRNGHLPPSAPTSGCPRDSLRLQATWHGCCKQITPFSMPCSRRSTRSLMHWCKNRRRRKRVTQVQLLSTGSSCWPVWKRLTEGKPIDVNASLVGEFFSAA